MKGKKMEPSGKDSTTICLSFSGLLREMGRGTVTADDLAEAIFYMGCLRERVFDYDKSGGFELKYQLLGLVESEKRAILQKVQDAVANAEAHHRVAWRESVNQRNNWDQLNQLLEENDLPQLLGEEDAYTTLMAADILRKLPWPIRVIA